MLTLMAIGHTTALAITNTTASLFTPNHRIANGRIAIEGNGLSIDVKIASRSSPKVVHTANVVSTAAIATPITMPNSNTCIVLTVAEAISPEDQPVTNARPTSSGLENCSGLTLDTLT